MVIKQRAKSIFVDIVLNVQRLKLYRRIAKTVLGKRVRYRTAGIQDAVEIIQLMGYTNDVVASNRVREILNLPENKNSIGCIVAATLANRIIGAIIAEKFENPTTEGDWWVHAVRVRAKYRGAGVGRGLIILASIKAEQSGARSMSGYVFEGNLNSVSLGKNLQGLEMKPQDYSQVFAGLSEGTAGQHVVFFRSIAEGLDQLKKAGILDYYTKRDASLKGFK